MAAGLFVYTRLPLMCSTPIEIQGVLVYIRTSTVMTGLDEQGSIIRAVKAHPRMALAQTSRAREVAVHATARACRCRVKRQCAELLAPHSGQCVIPTLGAGHVTSTDLGL
jgi:hypothetical protein